MPKYKDLGALKEKILNAGNEPGILNEKEIPLNDTQIPKKIDSDEKEIDETQVPDTNDLLKDILSDFDKGNTLKDEDSFLTSEDTIANGENINDLSDPLNNLGNAIEEDKDKKEEAVNNLADLDSILGESAELSNSSQQDIDGFADQQETTFNQQDETSDSSKIELPNLDDLGDLSTSSTETFDLPKDESLEEQADTNIEQGNIDNFISDIEENKIPEESMSSESAEVDNILDQLGKEAESYSDIEELDSLLGEDKAQKISVENESSEGLDNIFSSSDEKLEESAIQDSGISDIEDLSMLGTEESKSDLSDSKLSNSDDLDLDKLDFSEEHSDLSLSSPDLSELEEVSDKETKKGKIKLEDSSTGKIPIEISDEEKKANEDIQIKLTDEQRKKIIFTLTTLPKDAELKVAQAIISGKYSNSQLKPLIDALINQKSPQEILQYYLRITGDKSLAHLEAIKFTGQKFEELQKSFSYAFQKNILPILSILAVSSVVLLSITFFIIRFLLPTLEATRYYNQGKANIEKKIFWEVENNFTRAFNIQPRYQEVMDYARGYRNYKRYLEAEKKYELATNMRPLNHELALEYADFYREIKNYEKAEKKYKSLIKTDPKDLKAVLGLAKAYVDWSDEIHEKIEDAKEKYLDALDIDKNNKEAIYGKLNIYLKEKNYAEIMKHYDYIEKKFGSKIDPEVYANLAGYLIDINQLDDIKHILKKAINSSPRNDLLPEIEYQFARYNKQTQNPNDERIFLLRSLSKFDKMKNRYPNKYEDPKYQNMLANVYNDLGENYDKATRANPEAEKFYIKSIQTNPYFGKAYFNLANFALKNKPNGYAEAKTNYLEAETNGFTNDTLDYNIGWLYYREKDYDNSCRRMLNLLDKNPYNTTIKFFLGTVFYKLKKYDLSESLLLETYTHLNDIILKGEVVDVKNNLKDRLLIEMLKKVSNNLGATYQKKFENTKNSKYLINAAKYYSDSINYFDKLKRDIDFYNEDNQINKDAFQDKNYEKENSHFNLRMVLYPDAGLADPFIYEDYSLDFMAYL